jgi:predicted house-cleaning noncanonical NTP pyrophosphatase (MazG superfamily)
MSTSLTHHAVSSTDTDELLKKYQEELANFLTDVEYDGFAYMLEKGKLLSHEGIVSYLEGIVRNKKLKERARESLKWSRIAWKSSENADNAERLAAIKRKNQSFCTIS